ncbi:hypothetical protein RN001_014225 [Aquatica leii]|uniref:DUF1868 domain-containing protein n=1 Tax=Aquatica leii TaxID=1421715 RepID=A0AAN7Q0K6_9COLE|nr:hypothetical protein RN001_014225 [Aquatica leii]
MASWKVNEKGEYIPFLGYTILSMINDPKNELKTIEEFLTSSVVSRYYAPLPHHTYHMTLFNIFAYNRDPIPSVRQWLLAENQTLPKNEFLPEKVLKAQNGLATEAIKKCLGSSSLKIKDVSLDVSAVIKVNVVLDSRQEMDVKSLREDFSTIYEHPDASLKFHVTLAYLYNHMPTDGDESDKVKTDLEQLKEMIQKFKDFELNKHNVYLFDSMVNYMPIDSSKLGKEYTEEVLAEFDSG